MWLSWAWDSAVKWQPAGFSKPRKKVAVNERELIGGSCAYWACVPSKTLLRPLEARTAADRPAGVTATELEWTAASDYRNYMIRQLDDTAQVEG